MIPDCHGQAIEVGMRVKVIATDKVGWEGKVIKLVPSNGGFGPGIQVYFNNVYRNHFKFSKNVQVIFEDDLILPEGL